MQEISLNQHTRLQAAFALSVTGAFLTILNAAALLSTSFYNLWIGIFFWIPVMDPSPGHGLIFAIGAILGFLIFVGAVLGLMGHGREGATLMLPFAVVALIIGGGFVVGFVLCLIGGILTLPSHDPMAFRTPAAYMFCRECGAKIARSSKYCPECGFDLAATQGNTVAYGSIP